MGTAMRASDAFSWSMERDPSLRSTIVAIAWLERSPDWDAGAWGLPIPQPYMAFTLAEFCSVALRARPIDW